MKISVSDGYLNLLAENGDDENMLKSIMFEMKEYFKCTSKHNGLLCLSLPLIEVKV